MERKEVPKTGETLFVQLLKGNGLVNMILNPNSDDELCFTIEDTSFDLLSKRISSLSEKEIGSETMSFSLYENTIPFEEEEGDEDVY